MAEVIRPEGCYQATDCFATSVIYHFRAPFSEGQKIKVPEGLVFMLDSLVVEEARSVYATPVPADAWEEVFAPDMKHVSRYDGYSLVVDKADILNHCIDSEKTPVLPEALSNLDACAGCIWGTAVGDALGLAFEGMSPRRIARLTGSRLTHRLLFGYGMLSDDTEHTCMVAQTLIRAGNDPDKFQSGLAWRMRWWLLALPAGIGLGTLRALIKLWLGISPDRSGVNSAGNGPMMRSALLGVHLGNQPDLLKQFVCINTRITHRDPRAERAAQIIAWAAGCNATHQTVTPDTITTQLNEWLQEDEELAALVAQVVESARAGDSAMDFCRQQNMGKGVSGYCYNTLKVVLQIWLRHPRDFEAGITEAIRCGGDTDTVAAILGGIIGAGCGVENIPEEWKNRIRDWPRSPRWINEVIRQLADTRLVNLPRHPDALFLPFTLTRNLLFMVLVLAHGFRRLLPPY